MENLVRMLDRLGVQVVATFSNPVEALEYDRWSEAEAAFVDISMPVMNGIELAICLQSIHPSLDIVFVTAFDHYAVKAFEMEAMDYLVKPVHPDRLEKTLNRIRKHHAAPSRDPDKPSKPQVLVMMQDIGIDKGSGSVEAFNWRTVKAKEMFAYLAHMKGFPVSKEQLCELLWPEYDKDKVMANLHTTVYQVRSMLKQIGFPVQILYQGGRYRMDLGEIRLDWELWEAALAQAVHAADADRLYHLLLEEYRGDYLQNEGYLWAESERERLRVKWLLHAYELAERLSNGERYTEAIRLYQEIQHRFPVWEACYFGLMQVYARMGNAMEVKNQYQKLVRILDEELGMQPSREIADWFQSWYATRSQ
jgi:two-component SAPR family response regulator